MRPGEKEAPAVRPSPAWGPYGRSLLAAWAFVGASMVVAFFVCGRVWDDVTSGVMEFLVVVLGGGFTLMTAVDYFYEKYNGPGARGDRKP
ncbi:MAG TPA: hypothetical protein VFR02_05955 [bacterium]|nr:hypothetical protein [bacterium]